MNHCHSRHLTMGVGSKTGKAVGTGTDAMAATGSTLIGGNTCVKILSPRQHAFGQSFF